MSFRCRRYVNYALKICHYVCTIFEGIKLFGVDCRNWWSVRYRIANRRNKTKKKPSSWHYSVGVYKMQLMHIILYADARAFNTALRPSKHTACYWYQLPSTTYAFWMIYNKETFGHSGLLPWCRWFIKGCINVLISRQSRTRAETDRLRFGRFDKNTILFPFDCNVIKYYKPSCEINFLTLLDNRRRIRCILLNEYKASRSALVWFCFYFFNILYAPPRRIHQPRFCRKRSMIHVSPSLFPIQLNAAFLKSYFCDTFSIVAWIKRTHFYLAPFRYRETCDEYFIIISNKITKFAMPVCCKYNEWPTLY